MGETAILPTCDGLCVTASDVGLPGTADDIAYAHPGCPRHDPGAVCECGTPDRCMSPTHGQISHDEALRIRHAQNPDDPRATAPCCHLHKAEGCCDTNDCGPCCEDCPTCPTLARSRTNGSTPPTTEPSDAPR